MYAVIKAGGKQHRVKPGDVIEVELVHGGQDESVSFIPILVVDDDGKAHVGKELGRATVTAKLLGEQKGDKIKIFKYRPKSGYARRQGHRQMYTMVEIQDVKLGGGRARKAGTAAEEASAEPAVEGASAEETAKVSSHAEPEAATPNPGQPEAETPNGDQEDTEQA